MGLRFILGRAGTGKTYACLEAIRVHLMERPDGPSLILMVPEQATFQMEYKLISTPGLTGSIRAQVLSFRRLAWRVFQEVGGITRPYLSEVGRHMALQSLLSRRASKLRVFGKAASQPGFVGILARCITEMRLYGVQPPMLEQQAARLETAGQGGSILSGKLQDLSLLYQELNRYLEGRYLDPDDYLRELTGKIRQSFFLRGSKIWVDGFSGFTPQEYAVLAALLKASQEMNVTLCLDGNTLDQPLQEEDLFYTTRNTYLRLAGVSSNLGLPLEEAMVLDDHSRPPFRFKDAPALAHLERNFYGQPKVPGLGGNGAVQIVAASNRREEVEEAAREILRLCRDRGYQWRDISVTVRDLEIYHHLIEREFSKKGIPYFIDCKRSVSHHPLIELLRSALETVLTDWAPEAVFRFLKTDLVPVRRDQVDRLENYCLAHGIRGRGWKDPGPWRYSRQFSLEQEEANALEAQALQEINRIRWRAAKALAGFVQRLHLEGGNSFSVQQITAWLFMLLQELRVYQRMEKWRKEADASGDLNAAQEHAQVWNSVLELLDQLVETMGEEELSLEEYLRILEAGIENMRLGHIPPGLDQVLVASVERSRQPELKAALILGLTDGVFPARIAEDGILTDRERDNLRRDGLDLAPTSREQLFYEQFLAYVALTRPSEYLWLSYPLSDQEGKALAPSPIVIRLQEILSFSSVPRSAADHITDTASAVAYLVRSLQEARSGVVLPQEWEQAYNLIISRPEGKRRFKNVAGSLSYANKVDPIPEQLVQALYGRPLKCSVSRLESFAACPFSHFAAYGLRLKERVLFRLDAPSMGTLFHSALGLFVSRIMEDGRNWAQMTKEQLAELMGEVLAELVPRLNSEVLLSSARHRYLIGLIRRTLERAVAVLTEHSRRGRFDPAAVEVPFGVPGGLGPMKLEPKAGWPMEVRGRIDRIDFARTGERLLVRVIDYKSSRPDLDLIDIYHGLALQLLTYLWVAVEYAPALANGAAQPAAALYFPVQNPLIRVRDKIDAAETGRRILKQLKMRGLVLADLDVIESMQGEATGPSDLLPVTLRTDGSIAASSSTIEGGSMALLLKFLLRRVEQLGGRIIEGITDIAPVRQEQRTACQFCSYSPTCQFDSLLPGNRFQRLLQASEAELWKLISREADLHDATREGQKS